MGSVIFKILNYFYVTNQISTFVIDQVMFDHQVSKVSNMVMCIYSWGRGR